MSRFELTKIFYNHLGFKFYHKENELIIIDNIHNREYELVPTGDIDLPFTIISLNKDIKVSSE